MTIPLQLAEKVNSPSQGFLNWPLSQQRRKSGVKGIMLYALCHAVDSFVRGKMLRRNRLPDCQPGLCRAAMSASALRALRALIATADTAAQTSSYKFTETMLH